METARSFEWPLSESPMPVQQAIYDWLADRRHAGILADVGLGKTALTLADFVAIRAEGRTPKPEGLIVICPNSLKSNWIAEAKKMGLKARGLYTHIWPESIPDEGPFLWSMNYEALIGRGLDVLEEVLERFPCMLVLDESVQIKNYKAQRTKRLLRIGKTVPYKRILSGAPMVQGPHDLWAQLTYIESITRKYHPFKNRYCAMGGYMGKKVLGARADHVDELRRIVAKDCFRARAKDWTSRPPITYETRDVELPPVLTKQYRRMYLDFEAWLDEEGEEFVSVQQAINRLQKLQQITAGFIIDEKGEPHRLVDKNPRIEVVKEIFSQTENKILIFAIHKESVKWLSEELAEFNPGMIMGTKEMKAQGLTIDDEKEKFKRPDCRAMILQTQAGKYGHTLLGDPGSGVDSDLCCVSIFYENSFSLDDRIQALGRSDRWGQRLPITAIDLVSTPVDRDVVGALQRKEDVMKSVIRGRASHV